MKRTLHDLATLAARMGVGGIFFANGWQKLEAGLNTTADQFTALQAPLPHVWAPATMLTELAGGALLIAGFAVPVVGLLLFAEAIAVFILTAGDAGLPLAGGDSRLFIVLAAASVLLSVTGAGRISADHMVVIKRRDAEASGELAVDAEADAVIAALRPPRSGGPSADEPPAPPAAPDEPGAAEPPAPAAPDEPGPGGASAPAAPAGSPRPAAPTGSADAEAAGAQEAPATTARKTTPRQRRARREDETTTESRAEAPPAR